MPQSQNRKTVKAERDSPSHTETKIKSVEPGMFALSFLRHVALGIPSRRFFTVSIVRAYADNPRNNCSAMKCASLYLPRRAMREGNARTNNQNNATSIYRGPCRK